MLASLVLFGTAGSSQASDLIGSDHGGHYWFDYCRNRPDSAALPPDPRSLVTPTYDKAVVFNVAWYSCLDRQPATCGELRALQAQGGRLLGGNGNPEAGWEFSSGHPWSQFSISAAQYNLLYLRWGLLLRPADFDQLVAERYGTPLSAARNPYPLPGENPNLTNGGSGQLPMALTQTRNADGSWSGNIGVTCSICHSGQVGNAANGPGLGPMHGNNGLADVTLLLSELGGANNGFAVVSLNRVRGSGNITNFQLFGLLTLFDPNTTVPGMVINPEIWTAGTTGSEDPPNWWNLGHRPAKFYDAGMSSDSTRIELSWYMPGAASPQYQEGYDWILDPRVRGQHVDAQPAIACIPVADRRKARQERRATVSQAGLVVAEARQSRARPEGGNGSCASCHGAYAPRYIRKDEVLGDAGARRHRSERHADRHHQHRPGAHEREQRGRRAGGRRELVRLLRPGRVRGEVQPHRLSRTAALRRVGVGARTSTTARCPRCGAC
jgi:hypothetical protein